MDWLRLQRGKDELEIRFLESLRGQTPFQAISGRAAIHIFAESVTSKSQFELFSGKNGFESFRNVIKDSKPDSDKPSRRLVILEDLGLDWVSLLNKDLDVPLSILAKHWAKPEDHTLGKVRVPLGQDTHYHFIMNYVQSHPIIIPGKQRDLTYRIACNAERSIAFNIKKDDRAQRSDQLVSYWGEDLGYSGSWLAILLVDPPLKNDLRHSLYVEGPFYSPHGSPPMPVDCIPSDPLPRLPDLSIVSTLDQPLSNGKFSHSISSLGVSMFDDLVHGGTPVSTDLPSSATYRCRRLLLARAAATLQTTFSEAISLSVASSTGLDEMSSFNFDTFDKAAWDSKWEGKKFTRLWEQRENLELLRYKLRQNVQTIQRICQGSDSRTVEESPISERWAIVYNQEKNDLLEWRDLEEMAQYINQVIVRTTESYLQTVAAREAQVSNFQARSVGQLTRMATIFVPISLCAAIFSMEGAFAAGDNHFWIFWAVSLPIAGILIILMFTPLGRAVSTTLSLLKRQPSKFLLQIRSSGERDLKPVRENAWVPRSSTKNTDSSLATDYVSNMAVRSPGPIQIPLQPTTLPAADSPTVGPTAGTNSPRPTSPPSVVNPVTSSPPMPPPSPPISTIRPTTPSPSPMVTSVLVTPSVVIAPGVTRDSADPSYLRRILARTRSYEKSRDEA